MRDIETQGSPPPTQPLGGGAVSLPGIARSLGFMFLHGDAGKPFRSAVTRQTIAIMFSTVRKPLALTFAHRITELLLRRARRSGRSSRKWRGNRPGAYGRSAPTREGLQPAAPVPSEPFAQPRLALPDGQVAGECQARLLLHFAIQTDLEPLSRQALHPLEIIGLARHESMPYAFQ